MRSTSIASVYTAADAATESATRTAVRDDLYLFVSVDMRAPRCARRAQPAPPAFAVRYSQAGSWMYHCHILEHAERGMMGELKLSPRSMSNEE